MENPYGAKTLKRTKPYKLSSRGITGSGRTHSFEELAGERPAAALAAALAAAAAAAAAFGGGAAGSRGPPGT